MIVNAMAQEIVNLLQTQIHRQILLRIQLALQIVQIKTAVMMAAEDHAEAVIKLMLMEASVTTKQVVKMENVLIPIIP